MNIKKFLRRSFRAIMIGCVMAMIYVFMAVSLPDNPSTNTATVGKDYLLDVNTGTASVPVWTLVGGQRGTTLNQTAEEIDVSHKTSGGWGSSLAGMRGWSIDLDGLVLLQDAGIAALRQAFAQNKQLNVRFRYPDGSYQIGWASLTDFSSDAPHDGEASLTGTLSGNGPLSDISQTFSIANTLTDPVFYFQHNAKATSVTLAGSAVLEDNYIATTKGQITLLASYLDTLEEGDHLFYVNLDIGGYALVAVTVTA